MKKNEYYRHKWNKYVSKVTDVKRRKVELKVVNSGVTETIDIENFELNYEPCVTIYQWRTTIDDLFSFADIKFIGDTIRVDIDDSRLEFKVVLDNLKIQFTDDVKEAVDADTNTLNFLLEDADEVIPMFADLFE